MKVYRGSKCTVPLILNLALDGGDWFSSHPSCFTLWEQAPLSIQ